MVDKLLFQVMLDKVSYEIMFVYHQWQQFLPNTQCQPQMQHQQRFATNTFHNHMVWFRTVPMVPVPAIFQHPAPYYPTAPAPVPQPAPAQQPACVYQPTNVPVPQTAPMQQQTGYGSPAIPVTGSPQRIIRPAQVPG